MDALNQLKISLTTDEMRALFEAFDTVRDRNHKPFSALAVCCFLFVSSLFVWFSSFSSQSFVNTSQQDHDRLISVADFVRGVDVNPSQPFPQFLQPRSTRHHGDIIGWSGEHVLEPAEVHAVVVFVVCGTLLFVHLF